MVGWKWEKEQYIQCLLIKFLLVQSVFLLSFKWVDLRDKNDID